jgi:glucokinase
MRIVAADIGGTNARFAIATRDAAGTPTLGPVRKYRVADFPGLAGCWRTFANDVGEPLPDRASIAFATAIDAETIKLTNSDWVVRRSTLTDELGLTQLRLVNDFEAVAHGIACLPLAEMPLLFGADRPMPRDGTVTVLGPGTGLGVALIAFSAGRPTVFATEGGHGDFAALDLRDDQLLAALRSRFGRVSNERIVSGPGLAHLYAALAGIDGQRSVHRPDAELWADALDNRDALARAALDRLAASYGAVAGDLALAQGSHVVVLAGGLSLRMRDYLVGDSEFFTRFVAKGRFEAMMRAMAVRLVTHDEIGLFGAAAAYREDEK